MGAALHATPAKKPQLEPEINVTPLVDVCLVLLIIFMVIAPALEHGERVELPAIMKPDKKQKAKMDPLTLTLAAGGKVFYEKELLDEPALKERLSEIHARDPERRVVLKGDASIPYLRVRDTFTLVQAQGFPGVALLVSKKGNAKDDADDEGS